MRMKGERKPMGILNKLFGSYSDRELKKIYPLVDKIEALDETCAAMSDEALRAKTEEFKSRLAAGETLDDNAKQAICNTAARYDIDQSNIVINDHTTTGSTENIKLVTDIYDRMGEETNFEEIMGIYVPSLEVPIRPGRNLAVIIEVAAMNNRQKKMGYNAAEMLAQEHDRAIDEGGF